MNKSPVVALAATLLASICQTAAAQETNGWDVVETGDAKLATIAYESGQSLVVLCRDAKLDVILTGIPVDSEATTRWLEWTTTTGSPRQTWINVPDRPMIFAARPNHVARLLRQGGSISVRILPTTQAPQPHRYNLALPVDPTGVDQVLAACNTRLDDPRDDLVEAEAPIERPGVLANIYQKMPPANYPSSAVSAGDGEVLFSCIVAEAGAMQDCRIERETPPGVGFGPATLKSLRSARLRLVPGVEPGRLIIAKMRYRLE